MNTTGKEWLTRRTVDIINKLFGNQKLPPLYLKWKVSSMKRNQPETTGHKESDTRLEEEVQTSSRI